MENGQTMPTETTNLSAQPVHSLKKSLVIAEKPSVAQAIAKVIGATKRKDGYLEGEQYLVSWCVGHLAGLSPADAYNPEYSKWKREDLPILPQTWRYQISSNTKKQFDTLAALMKREDVSELIEATDAGREGELIFRLVYHLAGCKKLFKRLWISSMEDSAIRDGFSHLLPGTDYEQLYQAALCRAKADWLVGINGTRLFTCLYGGKTLTIGRVMTPTLALLVEKEKAVAGFKKEKFYQIELNFGNFCAYSNRYPHKPEAEKLRKSCLGIPALVQSVTRQEKQEKPPKLYDLTTLQREANQIYGFTAQQTLDNLQLLYEKKLVTYPRTDSRYLTEDMAAGLPGLCQTVADALPFTKDFLTSAQDFTEKTAVENVIDNTKVSDHHAIIPTRGIAQADLAALPGSERSLLFLIGTRLLCAVCPDSYLYADTSIVLECQGLLFTASGRTEISPGFKQTERAFLRSQKKSNEEENSPVPLPELKEAQTLIPNDVSLREGRTSPPKRYTEGTLLRAMETAGSEEFSQIEDAERKGLGTPATRAGIIEKLVKGGFAERKGKQLIPTQKGIDLTDLLPDSIKSAKLTAEWEANLKEVEKGNLSPEKFMDGIIRMVSELVHTYQEAKPEKKAALSLPERECIGKCPRCGRAVYEGKKSFFCSGFRASPPCGFVLWKDNPYFRSKRKELTKEVVAGFLTHGKVKMTGLYSEKKGVCYDAVVVMEDNGGKYVNFKLEFEQRKEGGEHE